MNARCWASLKGRCGLRTLLMLAWGVLSLALVPGPAAPQSIVSQRQLEYESARAFLDAHTRNWESQEQLWINWLDSSQVAEQRGDRGRLDAADRRVLREATELQRLGRLVTEATTTLAARRRELQEAIDLEIDRLLVQIQRSGTDAERTRLNQQLDSYEAQAAELRIQERELEQPLTSLYVRLSAPDPRMGIPGINLSIELAQRRLADVLELIPRVKTRIANLQRRLQLARQAGDAASSLDRFGAAQPVGAGPTRDASSGQVTTSDLTPQEELQQLTDQLALLEDLQRQLQSLVSGLRGRIPTGGGNQ